MQTWADWSQEIKALALAYKAGCDPLPEETEPEASLEDLQAMQVGEIFCAYIVDERKERKSNPNSLRQRVTDEVLLILRANPQGIHYSLILESLARISTRPSVLQYARTVPGVYRDNGVWSLA